MDSLEKESSRWPRHQAFPHVEMCFRAAATAPVRQACDERRRNYQKLLLESYKLLRAGGSSASRPTGPQLLLGGRLVSVSAGLPAEPRQKPEARGAH